MKRAVSSLALTLLLCACAPSASPSTSTESPAASTPESVAVESPGTATPEQAAALPAGLEPTGGDVLDYEEIRPIAIFSDQFMVAVGGWLAAFHVPGGVVVCS